MCPEHNWNWVSKNHVKLKNKKNKANNLSLFGSLIFFYPWKVSFIMWLFDIMKLASSFNSICVHCLSASIPDCSFHTRRQSMSVEQWKLCKPTSLLIRPLAFPNICLNIFFILGFDSLVSQNKKPCWFPYRNNQLSFSFVVGSHWPLGGERYQVTP